MMCSAIPIAGLNHDLAIQIVSLRIFRPARIATERVSLQSTNYELLDLDTHSLDSRKRSARLERGARLRRC